MISVSPALSVLALTVALITTAMAQLLYKSFFTDKNYVKLFGCLALFAVIPTANYFALQNLGMHYVYTSTAVSQVLIVILAWYILGESISRKKITAVSLIVLGVVLFNLPAIISSPI